MHFYPQLKEILFFCFFIFLYSVNLEAAEPLPEKFLQIDGKIVEDGEHVRLGWAKLTGTKNGRVSIQRRILGEKNKELWQSIASARSFARGYIDKASQSDVAYEYRVSRSSKEKIETGYWVAGNHLPAQKNRGIALICFKELKCQGA